MFTLFFRAIILYVLMIVAMRALGKRQLGQFQPYEFAMTILIADLVSAPMESVSTPLLHGILPVASMFVVHGIITLMSMRFDKVRAFVSGKPSVIISKGIIDKQELKRLCLSLSDVLEGLRIEGILDPSEVGTAVIEANGTLTAFQDSGERPPKARELGVDTGYEGLPLPLIMDGRIQENNLIQSGYDRKWLDQLLQPRNLSEEDIYLAILDTKGRMTIQTMNGTMLRFKAIKEEEVSW